MEEHGLDVDFQPAAGLHLYGLALRQIGFEHCRVCPFKVPTIFNGQQRVGAGHYGGKFEGPVAVALVTAKQ